MTSVHDRVGVLDALYRLQTAVDARDWDHIAATFLPDAHGYGVRGVEAIIDQMQAHLGGCGPTQHLLGNCVVEFDGAVANVSAAARVYHVGAGSKEGSFFECMGDYTDRWREVDGAWRLESRWFDMRIALGDFEVLRPSD